jgi:hypothetical protein
MSLCLLVRSNGWTAETQRLGSAVATVAADRDRYPRIQDGVYRVVAVRQEEVIRGMRRYLLVLDMDLLAMDAEHRLEPINYLVARQEQELCEVVVLSLVTTEPQMPIVLRPAAGIFKHPSLPERPGMSVRAEHRMNLAVQHLQAIGCQASGIISQEGLVTAVRAETGGHDYDEVILATGKQSISRLARIMGRDPVHRLRRKWGDRLITFPTDHLD